jgi:hypothetical protein
MSEGLHALVGGELKKFNDFRMQEHRWVSCPGSGRIK